MSQPGAGSGGEHDDAPAAHGSGAAGDLVFPPLVPFTAGSLPVESAPDPLELERAATAQRNKDALARLGRTVAGVSRSAADATGTAARDVAARTTGAAGAVRDQVADRVADMTEAAAGPRPVGDGVVVAGPGLPVGTGGVTFRPAGAPDELAGSAAQDPPSGSVVVEPENRSGASSVRISAPDAVDRAAGVARDGGDRAAAAGSQAVTAGRSAVDSGQQAAVVAGQDVAARAQQAVAAGRSAIDSGQQAAVVAGQDVAARAQRAGEAAQRAGAQAQQTGAAAWEQTRSAVSDAVVAGRSAVRERTAPPIDVEGLTAEVVALPGVARLAPDTAGRARGALAGQVAGAQVTDDAVTVRVVARYGTPLPDLADRIHQLAARYAEGRQTVVEIPDLEVTDRDRQPHSFDRQPPRSSSQEGTS